MTPFSKGTNPVSKSADTERGCNSHLIKFSQNWNCIFWSSEEFITQKSSWSKVIGRKGKLSFKKAIDLTWSLLKPVGIESVMLSDHLILCSPLLLPSVFPTIRVFSVSCRAIRWPKCWSFSFSISPSSEYSEFISFRINWFHLFAVQGILKSLFQHHNSKASIFGTQPSLCSSSHIILDQWKNHNFDYSKSNA